MAEDLTSYVLLPMRGLRVDPSGASASLSQLFHHLRAGVKKVDLKSLTKPGGAEAALRSLSLPTLRLPDDTIRAASDLAMRCLDAVSENGAKLVQLSEEAAQALRRSQPGMRLAPVLYYRTAEAPLPRVEVQARTSAAGPAVKAKITVLSKDGKSPFTGLRVIAFTDFAGRAGEEAFTNSNGEAKFSSLKTGEKIERLYVEPPASGYHGGFKKGLILKADNLVSLLPIDFSLADGVRHYYGGQAKSSDGEGVKIAVVDTGIDRNHPDLIVKAGACTVTGEDPKEWGPLGGPHGTHVAGIIGGRGKVKGVAPASEILSYRVFRQQPGVPSANFAISKAIDQAVQAGCHLINLSLKHDSEPGDPPLIDDVIRAALEDARDQGVVVIAATGNDGRQRVSFPALDAASIAVSALGRKGTYPAGSQGPADEMAPYSKDKKTFVAAFSNIGPEVDVIAPGVEIISTVPGGYAPMSGTSMATPAVTGLAARLLSRNPSIRDMDAGPERADAITRMVLASCQSLGFRAQFQGDGIPL
ncbi:S8 family peptidase [Luteolibacter luteus]|uniref:S8 family serine peptidase n=1 Tax=Luteolibacter luteus TaxID=2728835 RepID=A0A858RK23_9BACT|nr:S8 family serine peptidase [Luteolibacter luteus]QJE96844.1 S8 family serine peptidase [Luteolibacter luteus]